MRKTMLSILMTLATSAPALAQSDAASRQSEASLAALSEVPAAAVAVIAEGGRFSVVALRPVGHSVQAVLLGVAAGVEFTVELSAELVAHAGLAVGTVIVATATTVGWLLYAGTTAIAFVPAEAVAAMVHHEALPR